MKARHLPPAVLTLVLAASVVVLIASCTPVHSTPAPATTQVPAPQHRTPSLPTPSPAVVASPTPQPAPTDTPSPVPASATAPPSGATPVYSYRIIQEFPHDPAAWTQGLVFHDGVLYEGTGQLGKSSLRRVDMESGNVLQLRPLPASLYGEGVAVADDKIVQLTWHSHVGLVYDKESFELLHTFRYPTEGWGLTYDGQRLIMSDGTSILHFLDPETFEGIGRIDVYDDTGPATRLNELEYIQGEIFANVWYQDTIARIDPETGQVMGWIDLTGLRPEDTSQPAAVLNGIAYDADNDRLFVTGKLWPILYEIELVPQR